MAHNPPAPCRSHGGFPPFARAGRLPGPAKDLTLCRGHRLHTCCSHESTNYIRRVIHFMAVDRASEACRDAWSALQCTRCAARAGTQRLLRVCAEGCNQTYAACAGDFFAIDGTTQQLAPCRGSDVICSPLRELASGPEEACRLAGFEVRGGGGACSGGALRTSRS